MFNKKGNSNRARSGATTVEMALVAPVIFILIFGQIEFARIMMIRQSATNASREACRKACLITCKDSQDATAIAEDLLCDVLGKNQVCNLAKITVDPSFSDGVDSGTSVAVEIEVDFNDVSWLPPFFSKGAKVRAKTEMVRE